MTDNSAIFFADKDDFISRTAVVSAYSIMLVFLTPLAIVYAVLWSMADDEGVATIFNSIAPFYYIAAISIPVAKLIKKVPESVWAPAFILPLSFVVFYGLGPLSSVYASSETFSFMSGKVTFSNQSGILKANALTTIGTVLVFSGFLFKSRVKDRPHLNKQLPSISNISFVKIALIFVVGGFFLKYFIVKPSEWGMVSYGVPGFLNTLGSLLDVGLGLLLYSSIVRGSKKLKFVFLFFLVLHLFLAVFSMSKSELVIALLFPVFGSFLAHGNRRRLACNVVVIFILYSTLQPWISYGREAIYSETGTITEASYTDRFSYLVKFISGERADNNFDDVQKGWLRLNFSYTQSYVINLYESGVKGDTINSVWMYFVPRILWPGKPVMEGPGKSFHSFVTGREGTSFMAITVFADIFWNYGWWGVVLICPLIGFFYSSMSGRSIKIMESRNFIMMPLVLLAINCSLLGMHKFLVNGVIAVIPMYYSYVFLMKLIGFLFYKKGRA